MESESIQIEGQYDQIQSVRELVQRAAEQADFSSKEAYACQLAVSEALENIIRHGYGQQVHNHIQVTVSNQPGELTIELTDDAAPFNPTDNRKSRKWTIDDPPIGGLGIHIIHAIMDDVEYEREADKNRLKLRKKKTETFESTE
ncbi:MAG: ATP-binding protein [Anaerolineales bacterium]|jgi:serine/threonine-protein kinase RsbW/sigma-B regulation protein RsbU (phosphoserine phosphatase)